MGGVAEWWQTLLSVAAGGCFTLAGQWISARQSRSSAREQRAAARTEAKQDRRDAYEMGQLQEVWDAIKPLVDSAVAKRRDPCRLSDPTHAKTLQDAFFDALRMLDSHHARILDKGIRDALKSLLQTAMLYATGQALTDTQLFKAVSLVQERIGERLRALYGGPA